MSTKPALSVVMAVHNSAPYLREALSSVRWQTFTDWECICVDDGSTDKSPKILQDFADQDPRFRIFRQEKSGIVPALTLGDGKARADIIARMDSDDVMLPSRLATQYAYLKSQPECVGVGANVQLIDPTGSPIEVSNYAQDHAEIELRLLNSSRWHARPSNAHDATPSRYRRGRPSTGIPLVARCRPTYAVSSDRQADKPPGGPATLSTTPQEFLHNKEGRNPF